MDVKFCKENPPSFFKITFVCLWMVLAEGIKCSSLRSSRSPWWRGVWAAWQTESWKRLFFLTALAFSAFQGNTKSIMKGCQGSLENTNAMKPEGCADAEGRYQPHSQPAAQVAIRRYSASLPCPFTAPAATQWYCSQPTNRTKPQDKMCDLPEDSNLWWQFKHRLSLQNSIPERSHYLRS